MTLRDIPALVTFRPTEEDYEILKKLKAKLGVGFSQVLRIALRRLWQLEHDQK